MASKATGLKEQAFAQVESKQEEDAIIDISLVSFQFQSFQLKSQLFNYRTCTVDTHIHLWNVNTAKREWLNGNGMEVMCRNYDINGYYSLLNNQSSAPYMHLRGGIFMETDVVEEDIGVEISEITALCKNPYVCHFSVYFIEVQPLSLSSRCSTTGTIICVEWW